MVIEIKKNKKGVTYNRNSVNDGLHNSMEQSSIIKSDLMFDSKYKKSPIIYKSQSFVPLNIKVENSPAEEEHIEELLIDLSLLLTKLRNNLDEYESSINKKYSKRSSIVDLITVCISVGLRITNIIEEKYDIMEDKCNIINETSISCNWFRYWNENFPRNNLLENDINEFDSIKKRNELLAKDKNKLSGDHACTISCVRYGKSISDFKMLCKIANSLFYRAFITNVWFSKEYSDELDLIEVDKNKINDSNINKLGGLGLNSQESQDNNKFVNNNNNYIDVGFNKFADSKKCDYNRKISLNNKNPCCDNSILSKMEKNDKELLFDIKQRSNEYSNELSGSSKMTSFEDLFLPEILCTTADEIELNDGKESKKDIYFEKEANMCLRNNSRRTSIIIENIDYESLVEFNSNISRLKKSILTVKEVQKEVNRLIIESTGDIDYLEEQAELIQANSAQGVCCVAEGCKLKSSWWPFQGSTAGLLCGSAAGLLLGPVGVSVGAAVGGAIGLTFGKMLKTTCETRMNEILKECEERKKRRNESIINNNNNEYELLVEVFDDDLNNNNALLSDDYYNKYISKVTLNDILENIDVIP
ncbi:hypothetical protein FG386_001286 [Cryptosporidium ryanae]|uniref:uncharacterized protein n=1 Tax=Cryptosporidium ryanae TaxID=515981 RepID=UPI00351A2A76|nr:hypothetical protein FG386_001286 [Cryptosporidium ryanae]